MALRRPPQRVSPSGYAGWLVARLQDPAVYGATAPVELRETAISWVFLTKDRAYKLKKPVRLPYVDYSTAALRRDMCDEELRLNRRLAPEIYVDVRAVVRDGSRARLGERGDPGAIDHVVEMRRYDTRLTAAAALLRGEAIPVQDIGQRLAAFHADAPVRRPPGTRAACRASVGATVSALRAFLPDRALLLSREERLVRSLIDRCRRELERRVRHGCVRDGHGDLRAEHVLLTQPPAIVDCIEFDATRRTMDVGADLARLKVDLTARGRPKIGDELVAAYRSAGGDPGDHRLLDLWCAQESLAAARIVLSRHGHAANGRAEALLDLGSHFANRAIAAGD
jgi:aminoglycoside phosphotransferase family enzyme